MQPYTDVLFSTSGPVRNVSVTVKTYPGGAVATIYSDNGVTPAANPVITGNDGRFLFYAADGFYTITVSGAGITTATIGPILLQDYATTTPVASKLAASTGSLLVSTIAAGAGAVARTQQAKNRDAINFKDYGVADGVANDTAAFGNFLADCNGVEGVVPGNSTIKLSSAPTIPAGSKILIKAGTTFTGAGATAITAPSNTNLTVRWERYNTSGSAGTIARIDRLLENSTFPLVNEASIYSGGTYFFAGVSKQFNAGDVPAGNGPCVAWMAFANDNNSGNPVVAEIQDAIARQNNGIAFGINPIARNAAGNTGSQLVGGEIDVIPAAGTTVSGGGGLFMNSFNVASVGPVMQMGGVGGGTWTNGLVWSAIAATGAINACSAGLSCNTFFDGTNGTFLTAWAKLMQGQYLQWTGSGGTTNMNQNASGQFILGVPSGGVFLIQSQVATEGTIVASVITSGSAFASTFYNSVGAAGNAANATVKFLANSVTGRSINSGGTNNAGGLDYAEYEVKGEACGVIVKGQIIGFDVNGLLTDKWAMAVSFGVKSTAPNFVGGDTWHLGAGVEPARPDYNEPNIPIPVAPSYSLHIDPKEYARQFSEYTESLTSRTKILSDHRAEWEANELRAYHSEKSRYDEALEVERQKVDRIAYCGKVPVNVQGAKVGQWIIPIKNGDGIDGKLVDKPSMDDYLISVGRVRSILPDGRAEIVVKPV